MCLTGNHTFWTQPLSMPQAFEAPGNICEQLVGTARRLGVHAQTCEIYVVMEEAQGQAAFQLYEKMQIGAIAPY